MELAHQRSSRPPVDACTRTHGWPPGLALSGCELAQRLAWLVWKYAVDAPVVHAQPA